MTSTQNLPQRASDTRKCAQNDRTAWSCKCDEQLVSANAPVCELTVTVEKLSRAVSVAIACTASACFMISVGRGQIPAWPLADISTYAAEYPSVYVFRAGTCFAAIALVLMAIVISRDAEDNSKHSGRCSAASPTVWEALLWLEAAVCLGAAGSVSSNEDRHLHTIFAVCHFVGVLGVMMVTYASHRGKVARRFRAMFGASILYVGACIVCSLLMRCQMRAEPGKYEGWRVWNALMEWSGSVLILLFCWFYYDLAYSNTSRAGAPGPTRSYTLPEFAQKIRLVNQVPTPERAARPEQCRQATQEEPASISRAIAIDGVPGAMYFCTWVCMPESGQSTPTVWAWA